MSALRRRMTLGVSAAVAASFLAGTAPAQAITVPDWPTAGRLPSGCATFTPSLGPGGALVYTYTDTSVPTVVDVTLNGGTVAVIPPGGATVTYRATVTGACSGVGEIAFTATVGGARTPATMTLLSSDGFRAVLGVSAGARPDNANVVTFPFAGVQRRYNQFTLDSDFRLTAKVPYTGSATAVQGPWSARKYYYLRQTTLTSALSKAVVRKGKKVTVSGLLKYATNAGYVVDNGEKVAVQTKVGRGTWTTRATLTADAAGKVSWSFKPTRKTLVRLTHPQILTGRFTAGVTSTTRTVRIR